MRYMVDTNICIYLMRHRPPEVALRFSQLEVGDVVMSAITFAELCVGIEKLLGKERAHNAAILNKLTTLIPVMPFDDLSAKSYGVLRVALPDRKKDALDRLIAAHAQSLSLILVTNNISDFNDYPNLQLENWVS